MIKDLRTQTMNRPTMLSLTIGATGLYVIFNIRHLHSSFFLPLLLGLPSLLMAIIFLITDLPTEHYWDFHFIASWDFTSGTSKGTSWPLLFRMSASKRRVLSLGMTFSSCIFVHMASAFCQLLVSSESNQNQSSENEKMFMICYWKP